MDIGIIGLENTGKTTIFNAITGLEAEVTTYSIKDSKPNRAIVKLKDKRLEYLYNLFQPEKLVYATMNIVDMPPISEDNKGNWGVKLVEFAKNIDMIIEIVRDFKREDVIYRYNDIDPIRDIKTLDSEIMFSDYTIIEKRIQRLSKKKGNLTNEEKYELPILEKLKDALEKEIPLRILNLTEQEMLILKGYNLLSLKPLLIIINTDEKFSNSDLIGKIEDLGKQINYNFIHMCGSMEMDINMLDDNEKEEYMRELGIEESAIEMVKKAIFDSLGLISFFTVGKDEVRAWPIGDGTIAHRAASKIHTDIEKGFIKAQVVHYEDFKKFPDFVTLKEKGLLRLEGKEYMVKDGDIIEFRFNI